MKLSFKIMLACLCAGGSMNSFSQQYFRASFGGGISTIQYSADEISSDLLSPSSIGGGVTAEYIMFFNKHIGASLGVGVSMAQSKYKLDCLLNKEMPYTYYEDFSEKSFVYNAKFENWEEKQMLHTVDIPVGVVGKHDLSDKVTLLAGLGVRFQLPFKSSYTVSDGGKRITTGYYKDVDATLEEVPEQGFFTLDGGQEGKLSTKTIAYSAYIDLGAIHRFGNHSFYYGIYGQYGFTQINTEADRDFLTQFGPYDSPLNTTAIEKSRLLSFGVKLGYVLPMKKELTLEAIPAGDSTETATMEMSAELSATEEITATASTLAEDEQKTSTEINEVSSASTSNETTQTVEESNENSSTEMSDSTSSPKGPKKLFLKMKGKMKNIKNVKDKVKHLFHKKNNEENS